MDTNTTLPRKIRVKRQLQPSIPENVLLQTPISKNVLSLFSGAGGDTYGFEQAGWKVTHFSEFNDAATNTHLAQFPSSILLTGPNNSKNIKDIPDATFEGLRGKIDLIFAGFPCQGFSHAGKKRTDDPRNELVHEFVRATRSIQPKWIIGENVKGLLSRKGVYPANTKPRPIIHIIRELFETIGYKITYRVIDATEVGVPQLRKRLIIIGHKGSEYPHAPWEQLHIQTTVPTIRTALSSTLEGAVELPAKYSPATQPARYWISTTDTPHGTPHPNLLRLVEGRRNWSTKEKQDPSEEVRANDYCIEPEGLISFGVRKSGYHGQILDPDAPSKTIICAYNQCPRLFVGLYNPTTGKYYVRCLTPVECGQIQGFPKEYHWRGSNKEQIVQIGNAVPPPLASCIAKLLEKITFAPTPQEVQVPSSVQDDSSDEE
jgi:DNA (cytosine-5)-methyltransferase 1